MLIQWFITQQTDTLCMAMNKVIATSTYCQYCSQNIPNWSYTDAIVVSVVTTSILIFAFSSAVSPEKRTPVKYSAFQEKPFLGILSWQPADQSKLISALISDLKPEQVRSHSTIPPHPQQERGWWHSAGSLVLISEIVGRNLRLPMKLQKMFFSITTLTHWQLCYVYM